MNQAVKTQRDEMREKFVNDLGLKLEQSLKIAGHPLIDRIHVYSLPREGGRRYARQVYMVVFDDGSFTTAVEDGFISIEKSMAAIKAMALAADGLGEQD